MYLYLRIIENMIEGRPFLYQEAFGTVYHVAEKGVEVAKKLSWSSNETIVAFVDGDESFAPHYMLRHPPVQLIVASSPNEQNRNWIKQAGPGSFVTTLVVELWTQKEFLLTGLVLALFSTLN
jgi:hypothetical protein